jgi:hypothetical protein
MNMDIATNFEAMNFRGTHKQFVTQPTTTHLTGYDSYQNSYEGNQSQATIT